MMSKPAYFVCAIHLSSFKISKYDQLVGYTTNRNYSTTLLTHQHPQYHVYPFAVSSVDCDSSEFYIARNSECNSLLKPKPSEELVQAWGFGRSDLFWTGGVQKVKTVRLDTFLAAHVPNVESIEYVHIDAQGMDLDVLMSPGSYVGLDKAGMVEAPGSSTRAIYIGQTYTVATIRQGSSPMDSQSSRWYRMTRPDANSISGFVEPMARAMLVIQTIAVVEVGDSLPMS